MQIVFSDFGNHLKYAPLTLTKPVAELRFGILKLWEKWARVLPYDDKGIFFGTKAYLQKKFPPPSQGKCLVINPLVCPDKKLLAKVVNLKPGELIRLKNEKIVAYLTEEYNSKVDFSSFNTTIYEEDCLHLNHIWEIFQKNGAAIKQDYELITKDKSGQVIPNWVRHRGKDIFIGKDVKIGFVTIDATEGPVFIGKNTEIMDGVNIKGPFALCENSVLKMGAKIYGPTTLGPYCKVGGEVSNSVIQGYSNKAHDGFIGNSLIGEWCNLGADTNTSNLKNNYGNVKIYSYELGYMEQTKVQFCGVIMGDHSKTGINTMLNTATVVGVNANIFGSGFPDKYIPSFMWGGGKDFTPYNFEKAINVAKTVYERRGEVFTAEDEEILSYINDSY